MEIGPAVAINVVGKQIGEVLVSSDEQHVFCAVFFDVADNLGQFPCITVRIVRLHRNPAVAVPVPLRVTLIAAFDGQRDRTDDDFPGGI